MMNTAPRPVGSTGNPGSPGDDTQIVLKSDLLALAQCFFGLLPLWEYLN